MSTYSFPFAPWTSPWAAFLITTRTGYSAESDGLTLLRVRRKRTRAIYH